jgi:hypothetical protein
MTMKNAGLALALAGMGLLLSGSAFAADSQTAPVRVNAPINTTRLSWDLVGLAKLVQSGVDNKVVLSYIQSTPPKKNPTADELVYLHELGLSSEAMVALLNAAPANAPVSPEPQPIVVSSNATLQSAGTQAPAQSAPVSGSTVISTPAPAPTVVYTQPAPVYVQQPVVTYVEPVRPRVTFGFSFGHFFGHGHHGHWGGHHGGHWGHHGRHH